ncbi:dihydrolipoyllysine-residue acetyltransferase [Thioalkalicoccus limnaeus]|uniref:Acetyltransferase component of pyruvate dehydrogenase complex n=1 Tax=Thioalkalicoccus limnaeus TaxID=120681 RepID=A0ABV4BEI4_9GAMM
MATLEEIRLPDIGDFSAVPVIEILVAPGDRVEPEQSLLTLESDKATMEIPSPAGGLVRELMVKIGDEISAGDLLLRLETEGATDGTVSETEPEPEPEPESDSAVAAAAGPPTETGDAAPAAAVSSKPAPGDTTRRPAPVLPRPADMAAIARGRKPHASPTVRRFARELGVDLGLIKGTGAKGRILKEDVQSFVKDALQRGTPGTTGGLPFQLPAVPAVDFSRFGPIEEVPLPRIKRISGSHLHRAWLTVPAVTQFDEADITELEAFRRSHAKEPAGDRPKLTLLPFLLKAVAAALVAHPPLKASLTADGERLVLKHYTHIGIAVDTAEGLLVPVIRDVDRKGLLDLAGEVADLSAKARAGKLLPGDMQGGCFTISSLGGIGGTAFTPIVNHPEVAILGVSRAATRPVWDGEAFIPRQMLPLSLAYDHRVVDGADGARFTRYVADMLADIRRLLL